jgi:hypothetical protein
MLGELPRRFYLLLFIVLVAGNVSVYREIFAPEVLRIAVLEMRKKGSAVLVRSPNGATILINTGPDASILRALGRELPPWQRKIDTVLLTNEKSSVTGGLADVTSHYRVKSVVRSGTQFSLGNASINILSSDTFTVLYGTTSFTISSSTPAGIYISNGKTITRL